MENYNEVHCVFGETVFSEMIEWEFLFGGTAYFIKMEKKIVLMKLFFISSQ